MGWFKDWREKHKLKKHTVKKSQEKYESEIKEIDELLEKNLKNKHEKY